MPLNELLSQLAEDPGNARLHFEIAEVYHDLKQDQAARDFIRRGLELDLSAVPILNVFDEETDNLKVTLIVTKPGWYSKLMLLDGLSFYSFLLYQVVEYLLKHQRIYIIISLNNVPYLADMGTQMLLYLRDSARKLRGNIVCIHACQEICELSKEIGTEFYPEIYNTSTEAIETYKRLPRQRK